MAKKGQESPLQEMFLNQLDEDAPITKEFYNFVNIMGRKINMESWGHYRGDFNRSSTEDAYYENWNSIEVIYHIAPWLTKEQQRQYIGNDLAIIIFLESQAKSFNPTFIDQFGTVPQLLILVQPVVSTNPNDELKYRMSFLSRKNLKASYPLCPLHPTDPITTKNILLTKIHNSYIMTKRSPPFDRLYYIPRGNTLSSITAKFPPKRKSKVILPQPAITGSEKIVVSFTLTNRSCTWKCYCGDITELKKWISAIKTAIGAEKSFPLVKLV